MDKKVKQFIDTFTRHSTHGEVVDCFSYGCCYWFAVILCVRFSGTIVYAPIDNHFACKIDDRVYDIIGDVTSLYQWVDWKQYMNQDPSHASRIIKNCIFKEENQ